jgi:hypothetical protein
MDYSFKWVIFIHQSSLFHFILWHLSMGRVIAILGWTKINLKNFLTSSFCKFLPCVTRWHKQRGTSLQLFHWKINIYIGHKVRHMCKILIWTTLFSICYELLKFWNFYPQTQVHNSMFSYNNWCKINFYIFYYIFQLMPSP